MEGASKELGENGVDEQEEEEPTKLRSSLVTVLEPSRSKVKGGKIRLFSSGRTRSSSTRGSTSSLRGWWGKDVFVKAQLYLTPTSLCYKIDGMGVSYTDTKDRVPSLLFVVSGDIGSFLLRQQSSAQTVKGAWSFF
jgi:hypothetical protein